MIASLLLMAAAASGPVAPKPLLRDPVHDGAADASTVYDRKSGEWVMFYTNRRADLRQEDAKDVRWVHGTAIGTARSRMALSGATAAPRRSRPVAPARRCGRQKCSGWKASGICG